MARTEDEFIKIIKTIIDEQFYAFSANKNLVVREPVLVKTINVVDNTATIAFLLNPTIETTFYYPNRTGHSLVTGQKVYLDHLLDNPDQGWLTSNVPLANV